MLNIKLKSKIIIFKSAANKAFMRLAFLFTACVATICITACNSGVKLDDPNHQVGNTTSSTFSPSKQDARAVETLDTQELSSEQDLLNNKRSIYFAFNSYALESGHKEILLEHAKYLSKYKTHKILIQGNTDERGTSEYNLALGQKRAEAVRSALLTLGANDVQIEAVSLGKEKPRAMGHHEAAWQENRRVDIVY